MGCSTLEHQVYKVEHIKVFKMLTHEHVQSYVTLIAHIYVFKTKYGALGVHM